MTRFKSALLAIFAFAAILVVVPGAAMAAQHQAKKPVEGRVFGTLQSLSSNQAVITTKLGNITVFLKPIIQYVTYDQAAATAGLQIGDDVVAHGTYADGTLHADRLRYDNVPFVVTGAERFAGTYVSSDSTANTLTIQLTKGRSITFSTDGNTKYFDHGQPLTAPPTYTPGENIAVWAREYSNQVWVAVRVNVKP